jgi:inositol phosphorylceramide mannosyltransferase catalytic subunit
MGLTNFTKIFLILIFYSGTSYADIRFPNYDVSCDSMCAQRIEFPLYQKLEIPRIIHQIWFGNPNKCPNQVIEWENYSKQFGYEYRFWNEHNLHQSHSSAVNMNLIKMFIHIKNFWSASDILRCEILRNFGGIYVDCDFSPPKKDDFLIDIDQISPLEDAIFLSENHAPNIRTGAFFVCNGFMATYKNHPIMIGMCEQFKNNIDFWYHRRLNYDSMYITGPFLLNKVINGSFRIIPIQLSVDLKMWN